MTTKQLSVYKGILQQRLSELSVDLTEAQITICPEPVDATCFSQARDMAMTAAEITCRCKKQVFVALQRIERGEYGICAQCEENINPKRLDAVPWAALCTQCQEQEESQKGIVPGMKVLPATN